jgi:hypothetical protein
MSKTEVSGKQIKDGSIEIQDLSNTLSSDINTLKSDVATLQTDVAAKADAGTLATVATSGSYNDLTNKPNIPSLSGYATEAYVDGAVSDLVNSAPATLDTLKELSDALGADANFAATVAGQIGDVASDVSALDTRVTAVEADVAALQGAAEPNIADLSGVSITSPTSGQVLKYDGLGWVNGTDNSFSGSYTDLTNKPTLFSGSYTDLTNKPTLFDGTYSSLTGKPTLATVATSGSYADLSNKPTIPSAIDDLSDVTISSPSADQVLKYNGTAWVNSAAPASGATNLDGLTDVVITSPVSGHYLRHNGTNWVNGTILAAHLPVAQQSAGIIDTGFQIFSGDKRFNGIIQAYGGVAAKAPAINQPALRVQPAGVSQSIPLIYLENTSGGAAFTVNTTGASSIILSSASAKGLVIQGAASQSANLFEVQNSAGAIKSSFHSDGRLTVNALGNSSVYAIGVSSDLAGGTCLSLQHSGSAGRYLAAFYNAAAAFVGAISHDGSTTSYATTSDYRLKENFVSLTGALDRIVALPTYRFNFKANPDKTVDGCKAHEVSSVCPEAVNGEKDAVNADGSINPQSVDYSKLVPLLVAAVQELKAKNDALEARLATLENN